MPDVLLVNGHLFTAGWERSRVGSVAIKGGQIVAVGADLGTLVGPKTEVVDVTGGLVLPGFQDAHVHPVMAGVDMLRCQLDGALSADDCLDRIAHYAASHPEQEWITGGGWSMEYFDGGTPTRQALDAVVPNHPVILSNRDRHGSWVNTEALRRAGVDANTPDPADGRIERTLSDGPDSRGGARAVRIALPATVVARYLKLVAWSEVAG
ncbi:MAG TPA: amidohydrolase family protein, partial [Marmoricola sp.]|nr:amidohydrolase family protein [Marmoricola sp.]